MMFFAGLLGLAVGSFLNVLIDRIPRGEDVVWKPSHCDFCKKPLRWFEMVPVVSFVVQGGRCRRCKKPLSLQYPFIELLTAGGFAVLLPLSGLIPLYYALTLVIFSAGVVIFFIDLKHQIIPDSILYAVLIVLLILGIPLSPMERWQHVLSGAISGLLFFLLWVGTKGRGLGLGDVKLVVLLGLLSGYPRIVVSLYIAFLTGAVTGVILIVANRAKMKSRIPFGPFLIVGTLCAMVWGEYLLAWFFTLL